MIIKVAYQVVKKLYFIKIIKKIIKYQVYNKDHHVIVYVITTINTSWNSVESAVNLHKIIQTYRLNSYILKYIHYKNNHGK